MRNPLVRFPHPAGEGQQLLYRFANNYGASVIKTPFSYGGDEDLWELAVIYFEENGEYHICYYTPITDDVVGHLNDDEVDDLLNQIEALEGRNET